MAGVLPTASNWPSNVVNQVTGTGVGQVIMTHDPRLTSMGLPQYPPLPATMDATKIDEIRRTVYIDNLDSAVSYCRPSGNLKLYSALFKLVPVSMSSDIPLWFEVSKVQKFSPHFG